MSSMLASAAASAAVLIRRSLASATHSECPFVQVEVGPFQPEDLPLPQAKGEGDGPPGAVAVLACVGQDALDLVDRGSSPAGFATASDAGPGTAMVIRARRGPQLGLI